VTGATGTGTGPAACVGIGWARASLHAGYGRRLRTGPGRALRTGPGRRYRYRYISAIAVRCRTVHSGHPASGRNTHVRNVVAACRDRVRHVRLSRNSR